MSEYEEFNFHTKFTKEGDDGVLSALEDQYDAAEKARLAAEAAGKKGVETTDKLALNLQKVESGLSKIGLGQLVGPVSGIGQLAEEVKNLGESSGAAKDLAAGFGALIPILPPAAAGFLAIATPVAAIAAIGAAAGLGLKAINDQIERNVQVTKDQLAANEKNANQDIANIPVERTRSSKENIQIANDQQEQIRIKEQQLADAQKIKADIDAQYAALGSNFDPGKRKELGEKGSAADTEINRLIDSLNDLRSQAINTVMEVGPAIDAREKEEKATKDNTTATNARLIEIQRQATQEQAITNMIRTGSKDQVQARLDAIEADKKYTQQQIDQLAALPEPTAEVTAKLAELRRHFLDLGEEGTKLGAALNYLPTELTKNTKALVDITNKLNEAEQKHNDILAQRAIEDQRATETAALQDQIAAAQEQERQDANNAKQSEMKQQYMDNELVQLRNYQQAEARAEQDYSRNRVRKLQDLLTTLTDLGASRDVAGFISARNRGLTDIARGDEDAGTAAQRRRQDYEQAAQQRQQQFQAQLAQEQAAGVVRLKKSEQLQQQLAQLQERYAREDLAARRRSEDDAYRVQITALQQRQNAIAKIVATSIDPAVSAIYNVGTSIVNFVSRIAGAASSPTVSQQYSTGPTPYTGFRAPNPVTVNVGAVGEIVTPTQLTGVVNNIINGVRVAIGGR